MDEISVNSAKKTIRIAVIFRLIYNVFLLWLCAKSYSNSWENLVRIYSNSSALVFILGFLAIDSLLTVMWIYKPKLYHLHMLLHGVLGPIFNLIFLADVTGFKGIGAIIIFFIAPFMWGLGWLTFMICRTGRKEMKLAMLEQEKRNQ